MPEPPPRVEVGRGAGEVRQEQRAAPSAVLRLGVDLVEKGVQCLRIDPRCMRDADKRRRGVERCFSRFIEGPPSILLWDV